MTDEELLYGTGHPCPRGIFGSAEPAPLPPSTWTRQRLRAIERASEKAQKVAENSRF